MATYQKLKGTRDIFGEDMLRLRQLEQLIRQICYLYQYQEIQTPEFERTEVFNRDGDSSDVVNKEMYTFLDNGKRSLTLRPEGTAGIMRAIVENKLYAQADLPIKLFYLESFFRSENPQQGRYRIFHQFGVEVVGAKAAIIDVESIALAYTLMTTLGLNDIEILVNTLGDRQSRNAYKEALKEHFKDGLNELCLDCNRRYVQNPLRILDCKIDHDHELVKNAPKMSDYYTEESKEYFKEVLEGLDVLGIPYTVDERMVRGLDYYTHTVFEIISTHEKMGGQSTICGGGRYDDLLEYFDGPSMSGIGFGLGLERLLLACDFEGITFDTTTSIDVYVICLDEKLQSEALDIATICRNNGYVTEMDYLGRSLKAQFKSVDRKNAQVVVILGEEESAKQEVTIKNIINQTQVTIAKDNLINQLDEWFKETDESCHCHEEEI